MKDEILEFEIWVDTTKLKKGLKDAEKYARDTGRKLDQEKLIKLRVDEAKLQLQLNKVSELIRKAKKEGDKQLVFDLTLEQKNLRRNLTEASRQLNNYVNNGDTKLSRLQAKFNNVGRSLKDVFVWVFSFAALRRGFSFLFDTFDSFESAFAWFRKTLDATEPELKAIEKGIVDLSRRLPNTTEELSKIAEIGGQMGIAADDILKFTETVAKLSTAIDGVSAEEASKQLARVLTLTGDTIQNIDRLGSSLVQLGNNFKANEGEILNFAERIAGAGGVVGLTSADILGISAAFVDVWVEAEAWGTAVQKALLTINDAVAQGSSKINDFAKVAGISADEFKTTWKSDPAKVFSDFVDGLTKSGDQASKILDDLLGSDIRLKRAFLSIANANGILEKALKSSNDEYETSIALQEEFEKRLKTNEAQLQIQQNRWRAWVAEIWGGINKARVIFGEFFLKFVPLAFATLQFGIVKVSSIFIKGMLGMQGILWSFGILLKWVVDQARLYLDNLGSNVSILAYNMGEAFKALPGALWNSFKKAAKNIENFLNGAIDTVNSFAKKLGFDGVFQRVNFGINFDYSTAPQYKEFLKFSGGAIEQSKKEAKAFIESKASEVKAYDEALKTTALRLSQQAEVTQKSREEATDQYKAQLDEEQKALEEYIKDQLWLNDDLTDDRVWGAKKSEDAEKEYQNKLEENKKQIQDIADENSKVYDSIVWDIEDGVDNLGKFIEKIEDVEEKIKDFGDEATSQIRDINNELDNIGKDTADQLGSRFLEVESEIADLQESIKENRKEGGDYFERKKLQEDLKKLEEERLFIIENTTEAQREQAKVISELSEAQKIVQDSESQKAVLDERKKIYEAIQNGEKVNLDEIQDYENLKLAEGLQAKQDALNSELETIQANYDAQREALINLNEEKKTFEKEWTAFFGTEIEKQKGYMDSLITKLKRVIALQKEAGVNRSGFSSSISPGSSSSTVTTNNNQRRVDVTINANNNVDVDYALDKVNDRLK